MYSDTCFTERERIDLDICWGLILRFIDLLRTMCYNIRIHERQGKTIMLFNPETFIIGFAQGVVAGSFLATIHIMG
jgi:hypothetical protein